MVKFMKEIIVRENEAGQRMDKLLKKYLSQAPGSFIYKMLRKKNITLNGKKAAGNEILSLGDEIKLFFSEETLCKMTGNIIERKEIPQPQNTKATICSQEDMYYKAYKNLKNSIEIVYEDKDILLLNKQAGILSQKADIKDISVNEWLIGYLLNENKITPKQLSTFKPSICNRLDRNTSGLVLVAKDRHTASILSQTEITKHYTAFAHGKIAEKGTVNAPIALRDDSKIVRKVCEWGKPSITHFEPVDDYEDFTVLKLVLETGRTHQIRCHMSYIGHPLLGDDLYGGNLDKINRHALHCGYISFFHPIKNDIMEFKADLPDDMKSLLN